MRILLLFDLSSFHLNLRDGLRQLGHQVDLIVNNDPVKKIEADIAFNLDYNSTYRKILERLKLTSRIGKRDIIQLVNPNTIFETPILSIAFLRAIKCLSGSKVFSAVALENPLSWEYFRKFGYRISPHLGALEDYNRNQEVNINETKKFKKNYLSIINYIDGIIPSAYEYHLPIKDFNKNKGPIPFPINIDRFYYTENTIRNNKIVFLHGIQEKRKGFKGSSYIISALKEIQEKYPNDIEVKIVKDLPFNEYLSELQKSNVLLDQTNSYSPAMNALIGMSMGKVVLTGAEPEYQKFWNYLNVPFQNISPNTEDIKGKILWCLENKSKISQIGIQSRQFIENNHDYKLIAAKYLERWTSNKA